MMLESGYQEPLFVQTTQAVTEKLQESIPSLLRENHGVGIIGGYYEAGLPIVKKLTDMLGGSISVQSKIGSGTTFTVILPFHRDTTGEAKDSGQGEYKESLQGMKVLLVEDNTLNLEITEYLLKHEGCRVRTAVNGEEAVRIFEQSRPFYFDAILMDVMMPVMDGYTATRKIRAMDRPDAERVQIVAMTANAFAEDVARCKEAGMDAHLPKPFKAEQLVASIAAQTRGNE